MYRTGRYTNPDMKASPESAALGSTGQFHAALVAYVHCGGEDYNTTRRLFEDAHWVRNLNKEMPILATYDMRKALDSDGFKVWMDEGRTYASGARLIREKLAPVVDGEAA